MLSKILADCVVLLHLLWILFLIFGAFIGVRNTMVKILHIAGLIFGLVITVFDWYCPLTYLEVWLRAKHEPALTYAGSFLVHYAERLVYIDLPGALLMVMALLLLMINGLIYLRKSSASPS